MRLVRYKRYGTLLVRIQFHTSGSHWTRINPLGNEHCIVAYHNESCRQRMESLHNELGTLGARTLGGIELGMMGHHTTICIVGGTLV